MHPVLSYMNQKTGDMLDLLKRLVEIESPSTEKQAADRMAACVKDLFAGLGARAEFITQEKYGNHVRAEWGEGSEQLLILCHMDTVWPTGEILRRPFRIEGDKALGPGAYDMKAGIVHTYFAIKAIQELGLHLSKRIVMVFNTDEEVGSRSSRPHIEAEARKSAYALVLEPPEGYALKTFRKGGGRFEVRVTGKASHAGSSPGKGVSAITELAHQIIKLQAMNDFTRGTTVNVGVVTGGTRSNVVAAESWAEVDVRVSSQEEAQLITAQIKGLTPVLNGTTVAVTGQLNRPPMERTPAMVEAYLKAKALAAELGFDLPEAGTGGGSDGNLTAAVGCPTLDGLGCVGEGAHSVDEYIVIKHMPERAALLVRLLESL